jgi:hypothetical protein
MRVATGMFSEVEDSSQMKELLGDLFQGRRIRHRKRQKALLLFALMGVTDDATLETLRRSVRGRRKRRDPNVLIRESINDGLFEREYRMKLAAFKKLHALLEPLLPLATKERTLLMPRQY